MTVIIDEVSRVSEASVESSASAVHWGAIVGGALGAVGFSFFTSLSLLIGAFIGCVAGALGGYHRDES
jgi:uncharacterized protein YqgC (DUF456 family)